MSLVGPRPERSSYVQQFEQRIYRYGDRHRVKAGITGWAQVHGLRGKTSLADRVEWDNYYIENCLAVARPEDPRDDDPVDVPPVGAPRLLAAGTGAAC